MINRTTEAYVATFVYRCPLCEKENRYEQLSRTPIDLGLNQWRTGRMSYCLDGHEMALKTLVEAF